MQNNVQIKDRLKCSAITEFINRYRDLLSGIFSWIGDREGAALENHTGPGWKYTWVVMSQIVQDIIARLPHIEGPSCSIPPRLILLMRCQGGLALDSDSGGSQHEEGVD